MKLLFTFSVLMILGMSFLVIAGPSEASALQLVPCGDKTEDGVVSNPCDFDDFIIGVNRIVNFLIVFGSILSAVAFAYAGFLYMTARGNEAMVSKAHAIFGKVVVGIIIMFSAWLIVTALEEAFLNTDQKNESFLK